MVVTMKQLTKKECQEIIATFKDGLMSATSLSNKYGVSRQAIYKLLHKHEIDLKALSVLSVNCDACGKEIKRHRCRVRSQKTHFCDQTCQSAYSDARIGKQKMARYKVSEYFKLKPEHIVHFDDGNDWNCNIYNLIVFKNQQEHLLFHLGKTIEPIWVFENKT